MSHQQIAQTILQQIRATAGFFVYGSWGIDRKSFVAGDKFSILLNSETGEVESRDSLGYLRFKVSGRLHKGLVFVLLMSDDTYTVITLKTRSKGAIFTSKIVQEIPNVYWNELSSTIDEMIETK